MLDKIFYKNRNEAVMFYTNREPLYLYSDTDVVKIINIVLAPIKEVVLSESNISSYEDTYPMFKSAA